MKIPTPRTLRGLSMVEVLVTIGIIAVLSSLALVSFRKIRIQSDITTATSNLRQVVLALHSYAIDHDGVYPPQGVSGDKECSRIKPLFYEGYVKNPAVFINPVNARYVRGLGKDLFGPGKDSYFVASDRIFLNWRSGGSALTYLREAEGNAIPLAWDARADSVLEDSGKIRNFIVGPNGQLHGLFGYPDGAVMLLGPPDSVIRSVNYR